jgi:hypothetical protein
MLTFKEYLEEARRNPDQNPKISGRQWLLELHKSKKKLKSGIVNHFVSFTSLDKLGINPNSTYATPIGIYSYPAQYVIEKTFGSEDMDTLPFAGNQPYLNSFSIKGNIVDLNNMTNVEATAYYNKIIDFIKKNSTTEADWKILVDKIETHINESSSKAKFGNIVGGRFWYVTMKAVWELLFYSKKFNRTKDSVVWNTLFRGIGIDAAFDMGTGIIHTAERTQCVVFNPRAIREVKRWDNKWSQADKAKGERLGKQLSEIKRLKKSLDPKDINRLLDYKGLNPSIQITPEQVMSLLKSNNTTYLDNLLLLPGQMSTMSLSDMTLMAINSRDVTKKMKLHYADYVDVNGLDAESMMSLIVGGFVRDTILSKYVKRMVEKYGVGHLMKVKNTNLRHKIFSWIEKYTYLLYPAQQKHFEDSPEYAYYLKRKGGKVETKNTPETSKAWATGIGDKFKNVL